MYIKKLELENFRGVKKSTYEFKAVNWFEGKNGTGKSTQLEGIMWVLADETRINGSQSANNVNLNSPLDKVMVRLTTIVFDKDLQEEQEIVFERTYQNKKKKNSDNDLDFAAPTIGYKINSKTYKKADYLDVINNLINIKPTKDKFNIPRALMDYNYFNEVKDSEARSFITSLLDMPTDIEIIKEPKFDLIRKEIVTDMKMTKSDLFSVIGTTKSFMNKEHKKAAADFDRVDEEIETLQEIEVPKVESNKEQLLNQESKLISVEFDSTHYDRKRDMYNQEIEADKKTLRDSVSSLSDRLASSRKQDRDLYQSNTKGLNEQLSEERSNLDSIKNNGASTAERINNLENEAKSKRNDIYYDNEQVKNLLNQIENDKRDIEDLNNIKYDLKVETINEEHFKLGACPQCGYVHEDSEARRNNEIERIAGINNYREIELDRTKEDNKNKAEVLAKKILIKEESIKALNTRMDNCNKIIDGWKEDITKLVSTKELLLGDYNRQKAVVDSIQKQVNEIVYADSEETVKLELDLVDLERSLEYYRNDELYAKLSDNETEVNQARLMFKEQKEITYDQIKKDLKLIEESEQAAVKINNLIGERNRLNKIICDFDLKVELMKQLTTKKLEIIQASVNELFPSLDFKIVDYDFKGKLMNVCTPKLNGVQFYNVNDGAKYLLGLLIIEDLKKHESYEDMPIIIDRKGDLDTESFKELISKTNSQIFFTQLSDNEISLNSYDRKEL